MDRRTVRGEGTVHSVLVSLPGPSGEGERWVRLGRRRFEAVAGLATVGLHVLDLGSRTMVRPACDWGRVWMLGLATLFLAVNLIDGLVDGRFG